MFKNYKVIITPKSSVSMRYKSPFDGTLALLYFNDQKNRGVFDGNYAQALPFLEKTQGVYHTSYPTFENVRYYDKEVLIKRFDHDFYAKFGKIRSDKGVAKRLTTTTSGAYKNAFFSIERIDVEKIIYYFRGDGEVVEKLLSRLRFIGKKSSLGWGEIENISMEEIVEDRSIMIGEKLMRNVPVENNQGWVPKLEKKGLMRIEHPYWKKSDMHECWV